MVNLRYLNRAAHFPLISGEKSVTCFYTAQHGQLLPPSVLFNHIPPWKMHSSSTEVAGCLLYSLRCLYCSRSSTLACISLVTRKRKGCPRVASCNMALAIGQGGKEKNQGCLFYSIPVRKEGVEILRGVEAVRWVKVAPLKPGKAYNHLMCPWLHLD